MATTRAESEAVENYARQNRLTLLQNQSVLAIGRLRSAQAYGGLEIDGECTDYELGFVTDGSRRVWPVIVDSAGRRVDLLMGEDGTMYFATPAGVEPLARPHHGRWRTNRRHRRECRNMPH